MEPVHFIRVEHAKPYVIQLDGLTYGWRIWPEAGEGLRPCVVDLLRVVDRVARSLDIPLTEFVAEVRSSIRDDSQGPGLPEPIVDGSEPSWAERTPEELA